MAKLDRTAPRPPTFSTKTPLSYCPYLYEYGNICDKYCSDLDKWDRPCMESALVTMVEKYQFLEKA
jgi:hypothetical protein